MPYEVVEKFERTVAEYAGAKFGIAVDSCTNALFLCCKYLNVKWVHIPKYTYPGVANSVIHAGGKLYFTDETWQGIYLLRPYPIVDSALRFQKGMYIQDTFYCLSFHAKKHIPIGRGGMILCNDNQAALWCKRARFDGRSACPLKDDNLTMIGWNMYMTPEQAARGLQLFSLLRNTMDITDNQNYPDLSKIGVYKNG